MLKINFGITQRADITRDQFWDRWHIGHAQIARELADVIGMRRYIQSLSVHPEVSEVFAKERGAPGPFSGYAEAWYDSVEGMNEAMKSAAGVAAFERFLADELNFLDVARCVFTFTEEYPIIKLPPEKDVPGTMIKVLFGIRKRADLSHEEFWRRWHVGHAALAREVAGAIGMRKYIQSLGVHPEMSAVFAKERGAPPPFDGVAEAWFDSYESLQASMKTPEGADGFKRLLDDERNFLDVSQCVFTLAKEHPIIA